MSLVEPQIEAVIHSPAILMRNQAENLLASQGKRMPAFAGKPLGSALRLIKMGSLYTEAIKNGITPGDAADKLYLARPVHTRKGRSIVTLYSDNAAVELSPSLWVSDEDPYSLQLTTTGAALWLNKRTRPEQPFFTPDRLVKTELSGEESSYWQAALDGLAREALRVS